MSRLALISAIVLVLVTGCGNRQLAGNAIGASGAEPTRETSAAPATPVRPHELRLNDKDPCALIPRSDWAKFHIEKPGNPKQQEAFKSPECLYSNSVGAFVIVLVITEGIGAWRSGERSATPKEEKPVKGFPAISLHRPEDKTGCDVVVDVADGQYLLATVVLHPDKLSALPERCDYAHQWAESAMNTLVAS